ncbi:MAG: right-handed parallel beta-helix repeat-containing protein [Paludibacteraceae bacterium]
MIFSRIKNMFLLSGIVIIMTTAVFCSCVDESFSSDPSLKLKFSTDTLLFDTVFTTVGSATAKIMVYNTSNKNLEISSIHLGMGANSPYRLNVDGNISADHSFKNIEIRAKDSLFIFVETTVSTRLTNELTFVKDSIVFNTNSNVQDVKLIAYGQNMEVLKNKTILNDTILTSDKPYLIYGDLIVDTAKTLTLAPGCRLYFHANSNLVVHGNLIADGTREKPIFLRGDRMDRLFPEVPYNYVSNQWGSVLLLNPDGHHTFNFVTINSGYAGVYFYNNDRSKTPTLEITNCRIHNFLKYGLVVQNGDVTVGNTEISNTGSYSVYLSGGKHSFIHCTIANYFNSSNTLIQPNSRESNVACLISELDKIKPMETVFENCIISGSTTNEFGLMSKFTSNYHGTFKNCYIRNQKPETVLPQFTKIRWYEKQDTVFKNTYFDATKKLYYNFMPDSVSPARNIGDIDAAVKYPFDLNGKNRFEDNFPDAGAYEWQPIKK